MLTAERLRELLAYDPETGVFTRRMATGYRGCHKRGTVVGFMTDQGYVRTGVDGVEYKAHRLAWLHTYGKWPAEQIDHINGNRVDNRLANLREASHLQNTHNLHHALPTNRTSGLLGVCWDRARRKWVAQIDVNGKHINLGRFDTKELAKEIRDLAAAMLHPFSPEARA